MGLFQRALGLSLVLAFASAGHTQSFDLVISNGRVMDPETGFDSVANVGITNGVITEITTNEIEGARMIDATGHVVAPGFIDGHSHVVDMPFGQKIALRDGVTTFLDLEIGVHPVDRWYDSLAGKSQTNYGATVSSVAARATAFNPLYDSETGSTTLDFFSGTNFGTDYIVSRASPDERATILRIIENGLKQGAIGVGPPVGYMVNGFSSEEFIGMQKLVAKYGRLMHVHTRFSSQISPTSGILAFQEAIDPMVTYGGGTIIAHFTAQALAQTGLALEYVDALREKGFPVILEVYPYNFGGAGNGIQADYLKPDNFQNAMGRSYGDIIDSVTGERLDQATYERLVKEDPTHPVLFYHATEEDMLKGVGHPDVLIGCDCFPLNDVDTGKLVLDWDTPWAKAAGHPRGAGTHAKVLRLTREGKVDLTLMQAVSKMSYLWAKFLEDNGTAQMARKGRIQKGADADIAIFDPETVTDNSTLNRGKNTMPSTGIPYVIVNGTVVVDNSRVQKVFPGVAIRNAIAE